MLAGLGNQKAFISHSNRESNRSASARPRTPATQASVSQHVAAPASTSASRRRPVRLVHAAEVAPLTADLVSNKAAMNGRGRPASNARGGVRAVAEAIAGLLPNPFRRGNTLSSYEITLGPSDGDLADGHDLAFAPSSPKAMRRRPWSGKADADSSNHPAAKVPPNPQRPAAKPARQGRPSEPSASLLLALLPAFGLILLGLPTLFLARQHIIGFATGGTSRATAVDTHASTVPAAASVPAGHPLLLGSLPRPGLDVLGLLAAALSAGGSSAGVVPPVGGTAREGQRTRVPRAAAAPRASRRADNGPISLVALAPQGLASPYRGTPWTEVLAHMSTRLAWADERFQLRVFTTQQLANPSVRAAFTAVLEDCPIFLGVGLQEAADVQAVEGAVKAAKVPTTLYFDSAPQLQQLTQVDGYAPASATSWERVAALVSWSREARAARILKTVQELWGRTTSDDLLFTWLVLLNEYTTTVPAVANTTKGTDAASLQCMVSKCGQQIVDCVTDKTCKGGLDCLQACSFNDQVCQYRCIASYESPLFTKFSLCILELNNCRNLTAEIPPRPDPAPMSRWRGVPVTHDMAERMLLGWNNKRPWSWLVASGKNPAYDYFPCQHQLFSRGKGKGSFWYQPIFKVITLDGQAVWRERRYRVRRGDRPGTFFFSVSDNGVTSNEFWRILDCADDLSYCLWYYSGAASKAGLSYTGAVLGTPDGGAPHERYTKRIHAALDRAGIKPWELSTVDNSACEGAPLPAPAVP